MDDDRFYVKTLTLENFRCFEKTELGPFDPHFNLLVGENGSGKSSVLVALADLLAQLAMQGGMLTHPVILDHRDTKRTGSSREFPSDSILWRIGAHLSWRDDNLRAESGFMLATANPFPSVWKITDEGDENEIDNGLYSIEFGLRRELLLLYTTRRQFGDIASNPAPSAYLRDFAPAYENWSDAGVSSVSLREWMRDQTLVALQSEQRARVNASNVEGSSAHSQLALVQEAVRKCIEGATKVEYDAELQDIILQMDVGPAQPFRALSDGQRALFGLVADIARRACLHNYGRFGAATLQKTPGLVLIDEIDLHLHPKWQRQIIKALKDIFPKIQFFATTHSPQVIGEAQPHEIVLLTKDGKQKRPMGSFGMDSNWILECVMEAQGRNPEVAKRVSALFDLIDEGRFEEARAEIDSLRREIGPLAPDIAGAESYMWRIEHEADEAAE